jgi:hypothetical protein
LSHCDSPELVRELRLSIAPIWMPDGTDAAFLFQSQTISEALRPPIDIFDFARLATVLGANANHPIITICSFCQRIHPMGTEDESPWVSAEDYYRGGGTSAVRLSHGLCADCYKAAI